MRQFNHLPVDDSTTYRFANSLRHQFLTHANDPNVAWYTLRSAALRLLPSVMSPKVRPVWSGLAMCLDIFVEPCQNPSGLVWEAFGTAFMMRSGLTVRAASLFSGPPLAQPFGVSFHSVAHAESACPATQAVTESNGK